MRHALGIALLILGAAAIIAAGLLLGHSHIARMAVAVAGLATFPLIERILP